MSVAPTRASASAWTVLIIFLKLGLTSFGGPIAHLGYFRDEFVGKRRWLSDDKYADLVALCQFLPGPASSQVGMAIGALQAGYKGAMAAWLGFTLPSAIVLILFALGMTTYSHFISPGVLHGLKIVAVAIVAQAIWGMAKSLCPDIKRITIMMISACVVLSMASVMGQLIVIIGAGLLGAILFKPDLRDQKNRMMSPISMRAGIVWLLLFTLLLLFLPIAAALLSSPALSMIDQFYRVGTLVFGGGHVVLPLLQTEVVASGEISETLFLAGYGVTQAVPGPLFTFAAFLGAAMQEELNGWLGGMIALVSIFLPSFFLVFGVLPFWERVQSNRVASGALMSVNAAVVGILLAAFYDPIWTSAILRPQDFSLALVAFMVLVFWKFPPWSVVLLCGFAGWLLA